MVPEAGGWPRKSLDTSIAWEHALGVDSPTRVHIVRIGAFDKIKIYCFRFFKFERNKVNFYDYNIF